MEVGAVGSGIWISIPLHSFSADVAFAGPDSDSACMTVMATAIKAGALLEEVFFHAEKA